MIIDMQRSRPSIHLNQLGFCSCYSMLLVKPRYFTTEKFSNVIYLLSAASEIKLSITRHWKEEYLGYFAVWFCLTLFSEVI